MADSTTPTPRKNNHIPTDLLNDLSSRFIINVPEEERIDLIRVCFQIELAHWFYLDFYCEEDSKLPKCSLKEFIRIIFGHIPFLQKYSSDVDSVIGNWREYKMAVPTFGAILLDKDLKNTLLVQSYVFKASWGFPKGKVNKDELPHHCAIREVLEETGYDISKLIDENQFLEHYFNDQLIRLYIIPGVPSDIKFQPQTRKEIKSIQWFPLSLLPVSKKDQLSKTNLGSMNFFLVIPFVKQLKKWLANKASAGAKENAFESNPETDRNLLLQQHLFAKLSQDDFAMYRQVKVESKSNSPVDNKMSKGGNKRNTLPPRLMHQKNLKQSTENDEGDLLKHDVKLVFENSSLEHQSYKLLQKAYSPPPRMIKQKNSKQYSENDKKRNQNEDKISSKNSRRVLDFSSEMYPRQVQVKCLAKKETYLPYSKTWSNFYLDTQSLMNTFCLGLRAQNRSGINFKNS